MTTHVKQSRHLKKYQGQDGFSLLEVLLVIGVVATLSLGIIQLTNGWANQERNLSTARHLRIVHHAAESYIRDNFNTIMTALTSGAGVLEIPIDDAGGSTFFLKEGNTYLSSTFNAMNAYRQTVTVLVRNASLTAAPEDQRIEAVVVTSGRPLTLEEAIDTAQAAGAVGGLIAGMDMGTYGINDFGSVYGSWTTSLTNYLGLTWDDTNLPLDQDRAHLAAFIEVNYKNIISDYLYRVEVPGVEDANRMQTNLDMNTNTITNTAQLGADRVNVSGDMNVSGTMVVDGGTVMEGAVTVGGGFFVEDGIELGDMVTQGSITTPEMNVTNSLQGENGAKLSATNMDAAGGVSTLNFNALTMEMNNGAIDVNGTGAVAVGEISNISQVNAGAIGASEIRNATISSPGVIVNQAIQIDGDVQFSGSVVTPNPGTMALGTLQNCYTVTNGVCQ